MSDPAVSEFDLCFELAASLAELLLLIEAESKASCRPLTMAAAVVTADSRAALMRFHEQMEHEQ